MGVPCSFETDITDLTTENGRKGYEGGPRNILVFGLRETHATQVQRKLGCTRYASYKYVLYFVEIKWVYLSIGPSAATTDAHVFSGNLSCIFWWSMRRNVRSPRLAVHASGGSGPRSRNQRQLLGCAQQTPQRVLIDKGNRTPVRCPKMVARGVS